MRLIAGSKLIAAATATTSDQLHRMSLMPSCSTLSPSAAAAAAAAAANHTIHARTASQPAAYAMRGAKA